MAIRTKIRKYSKFSFSINPNGSILLIAIAIMVVLFFITTALLSLAQTHSFMVLRVAKEATASNAADAGIQQAMVWLYAEELNGTPYDCPPPSTSPPSPIGPLNYTYSIYTVSCSPSITYKIESTGYSDSPQN
ncbi:MAG: hypothetical protein M1421_06605, partial [Candidatus Eremiobacteraeota bacterium]|nr:hypothetical protein [Candidatus Eremiobacteraeota bacterium]